MFKKLASSTISQILSKIVTSFLSLFLIATLTKFLPIEMYWAYNKIYNYLWFFAYFADLWLYTFAIREISQNKNIQEKIVWNIMTLRLFLWIFILLIAVLLWLFLPWYDTPLMIVSIWIVSLFTLFSLFNSTILSLMQANMKMEFTLFSSVFWKVLNLFFIFYIIYFLFPHLSQNNYEISFIFILISWFLGILATFFLNFFYALKISKIRFLFDFNFIKYIFIKSLPYWIALFLSIVYFKIDIVILSLIESPNLSNVSIALYSLPMKIVEVLMVFGLYFLNSLLPILSGYFKRKDDKKFIFTFKNSFYFMISFSSLLVVLWMVFQTHIVKILATDEYLNPTNHIYNSLDVFYIVWFVLIFYFISSLYSYVFLSIKKEKIILYTNIIITILNIILNIILIQKYSFIWAWIATLISQIFLFLFLFIYLKKEKYFFFDLIYFLKVFFIGLVYYFLFSFILLNFSFWVYFDLIFYGFIFFVLYLVTFYLINKNLFFFNNSTNGINQYTSS